MKIKIFVLVSIVFLSLSSLVLADNKISSKSTLLSVDPAPKEVVMRQVLVIPECKVREEKYYTQSGGGGFITPVMVGFCNCDGGGGIGGAGYFPTSTSHLRVDIYPDCPPPYYIEEEVKENE
ncbi:MAG: hypothetical protein R3B60_00300 [Candidatus Paceibacterota bacterium]